MLDARYASLPVQIGILAVSLAATYPALQPAWFGQSPATPRDTLFGEKVIWLASTNATQTEDMVTVEAWWQGLAPIPRDYSVFVHLLNERGEVIAQADTLLADSDNRPTTQWPEGYAVFQTYESEVPEEVREVRIGLYDVTTLERLPIFYEPFSYQVCPSPGGECETVTRPTPDEDYVSIPLTP